MLAHEVVGSGEPLLLIHGVGHRRQAWAPVIDQLAEHHQVITVDLPGHGQSPGRLGQDGPIQQMIHDGLAELADEVGFDKVHVAGNSLGGLIALELGAQDRALSVTALSPAGFWMGNLDYLYIRALFGGILGLSALAKPVIPALARTDRGRAALFSWLAAHPSRIDPELAVGDFENMVSVRRNMRAILDHGRHHPLPDAPLAPTTIAWATRDVVLLPYQALRARKAMPLVDHVWLHGCGHVPMSDDPELVAATILARTGAVTTRPNLQAV